MGDIHFDTNQQHLVIPIVSVVVALALALALALAVVVVVVVAVVVVVVVAGPVEACMSLLPFRIRALNKPSQAIYIESRILGINSYIIT